MLDDNKELDKEYESGSECEMNPLDNSSVHPERYSLVNKICKTLKSEITEIIGNEESIAKINPDEFITDEIGAATLNDILSELKKPGRDPRKMVKVFEFSKILNLSTFNIKWMINIAAHSIELKQMQRMSFVEALKTM